MLWFPVVFTFDGLLSESCHKEHIFPFMMKTQITEATKKKNYMSQGHG